MTPDHHYGLAELKACGANASCPVIYLASCSELGIRSGGSLLFGHIRPCRTKGALEVIPDQPISLHLDKIEQLLGHARFTVINAGILLVCSRDDLTETTLYEDGRMLVKSLDPREAHKSASRVFWHATGNEEDADYDEYVAAGRVRGSRK